MELNLMDNVTFTSNTIGTIDGNGEKWWGIPGIGYLRRGNDRPKLFRTEDSKNLLVENLGPNSIEIFWLEFRLEKPLEFWLEISLH